MPEEKKKPPYSYASLIRLAIINSESQKVLSTIAQFEQSSDDFLASQDVIRSDGSHSLTHWSSANLTGDKGVSLKHVFDEKNWLNPLCKYLEAALKESKRIFDFDKF